MIVLINDTGGVSVVANIDIAEDVGSSKSHDNRSHMYVAMSSQEPNIVASNFGSVSFNHTTVLQSPIEILFPRRMFLMIVLL